MSQNQQLPANSTDLMAAYQARLAAGQLRPDPAQQRVIARLQTVIIRRVFENQGQDAEVDEVRFMDAGEALG